MGDVLVIAEVANGTVRRSTLSALAAAQQASRILGGTYSILLLGHGVMDAAASMASFGASRILVCDHPSLEPFIAERFVPTAASVALDYQFILAVASSFGKDLLPRIAARLDAAYAGDCSAIVADSARLIFERPMYAGNILGYCALTTNIQTATVRQSEFSPMEPVATNSPSPTVSVELVAVGEAAGRVEFISLEEVKSDRPDLGDARRIVTGGRPLGKRFFEVLEPLAEQLGAAIGATRAACDAGCAPGHCQIGQTGKVVAPDLYLAVGVSGALQHTAGMRNSRVIVAINRDPEAPIFEFATYGLVADLFETVPALLAAIAEYRSGQ